MVMSPEGPAGEDAVQLCELPQQDDVVLLRPASLSLHAHVLSKKSRK